MTLLNNGDGPQQNFGPMTRGQKALFKSQREMAGIDQVMYKAGFGYLAPGQIMGKNSYDSKLVPYVPDTYVIGVTKGVTPVLADVANAATTLYVSMDDSYKFVVGDSLILREGTVYADCGAITAIDRTTDNWRALITFTTATAVATFTTANSTVVYPKSGTTGKFSAAFTICDMGVDTGYGYNRESNAAPHDGLASAVFKNAVLYKNALVDYDSTVLTGLAATTVPFVFNNKLFI
jgi:hypothetical protein